MQQVPAPVVDIHCHLFDQVSSVGIDLSRLPQWARADVYLDAGSAGAASFHSFADWARRAGDMELGEVYGLVNVAEFGLDRTPEITEPEHFQPERAVEAAMRHPDVARGLKVRAVQPAVRLLGMTLFERTVQAAAQADLPIMVHFGEQSGEAIDDDMLSADILSLLRPGDIAAHIYTGQPGGFFRDERVMKATRKARERGVLFDIGHGRFNFSMSAARHGMSHGFAPDFISSDVTSGTAGWLNLPYVMAAMCAAGMSEAAVIDAVTRAPSAWLKPRTTSRRHIVVQQKPARQSDSMGFGYECAIGFRTEAAIL